MAPGDGGQDAVATDESVKLAMPNRTPTSPKGFVILGLSFLLSLLVGIGLAVWSDRRGLEPRQFLFDLLLPRLRSGQLFISGLLDSYAARGFGVGFLPEAAVWRRLGVALASPCRRALAVLNFRAGRQQTALPSGGDELGRSGTDEAGTACSSGRRRRLARRLSERTGTLPDAGNICLGPEGFASISNGQDLLRASMAGKHFLSRASWTLVDQCVVSGGNFLLNVLLARTLSQEDYGEFALFLGAIFLLRTVDYSFISYPLSVRLCVVNDEERPRLLGNTVVLTVALSLVLLVLMAIGTTMLEEENILLPACLCYLCWQAQETSRRFLLADFRYREAVAGDGIALCRAGSADCGPAVDRFHHAFGRSLCDVGDVCPSVPWCMR